MHLLGHAIDADGVHVDPERVEAVQNARSSENVIGLHRSWALADYYRRCISTFTKVSSALYLMIFETSSLQKSIEVKTALENRKNKLTCPPGLVSPDFKKLYIVVSDAPSKSFRGAVLLKKQNGMVRTVKLEIQGVAKARKKIHRFWIGVLACELRPQNVLCLPPIIWNISLSDWTSCASAYI